MSSTPGPALSDALVEALYHCADCSYCVDAVWPERGIDHVCATHEEYSPLVSYTGRGYLAAARAWREGQALDPDTLAERVFTCTVCANCEAVCPIGLEPATVVRRLRTALLDGGHAPAPIAARLAALAGEASSGAAQGAWADGLDVPPAGDLLYFPGCAAAHAHPAEAAAAWRLLAASGARVSALASDACRCGAPQRELGDAAAADAAHASLAAQMTVHGAATCVSSGAVCLRAWPDGTARPIAFHAWLAGALADGTLRIAPGPRLPKRVAVLDSCQHRSGDDGAQVRALLEALDVSVVNDGRVARYVVCCGAGGGMPDMQGDAARRMAAARAAGAADCDALVGLDPRCLAHVAAQSALPVYGLAEFVDAFFEVSR